MGLLNWYQATFLSRTRKKIEIALAIIITLTLAHLSGVIKSSVTHRITISQLKNSQRAELKNLRTELNQVIDKYLEKKDEPAVKEERAAR